MSAIESELAKAMCAAQTGDGRAYRALLTLVSQYLAPRIRRMQYRLGGRDTADPEDILQETLMAIHKRLHTYDSQYPVTVWINAIARHKLIDAYRAAGNRLHHVNLDEIGDTLADPHEAQPGAAQDVARVLSGLPANLRRPIEDVKLMGLTIAESAARHGMSESAVKIGIHRGMKRLVASFAMAKTANVR